MDIYKLKNIVGAVAETLSIGPEKEVLNYEI